MNIDEMQAGRELDSRMAELMGYECVCDDEPTDCPIHNFADRDTLLSYSTDERYSGFVVDWLVAQGYGVTVYTGPYAGGGVGFWCCVTCPVNFKSAVTVIADTRPLAICRAALKAGERWGDRQTSREIKKPEPDVTWHVIAQDDRMGSIDDSAPQSIADSPHRDDDLARSYSWRA